MTTRPFQQLPDAMVYGAQGGSYPAFAISTSHSQSHEFERSNIYTGDLQKRFVLAQKSSEFNV
jgi:hypothetical protein